MPQRLPTIVTQKALLTRFPSSLLHSHSGFTLLELLIVFSILTILTLAGIASFVTYSRQQALNTAILDVASKLSTAKSSALSQIVPTVCTGGLQGYTFTWRNNPSAKSTFNVSARCGTAEVGAKTYTLPNGITFDSCSSSSVFFPILTGGSTGGTIAVVDGSGTKRMVTVDPAGNVDTTVTTAPVCVVLPTPTPTTIVVPTPTVIVPTTTPTSAPLSTPTPTLAPIACGAISGVSSTSVGVSRTYTASYTGPVTRIVWQVTPGSASPSSGDYTPPASLQVTFLAVGDYQVRATVYAGTQSAVCTQRNVSVN